LVWLLTLSNHLAEGSRESGHIGLSHATVGKLARVLLATSADLDTMDQLAQSLKRHCNKPEWTQMEVSAVF